VIELEGVRFRQGDFELSVDLSVQSGQRLAVVGASGAGKSTLLDLFAGFKTPQEGRVCISGQDVTALSVSERPVSILFQDGNLFPHLTVFENVAVGLRPDLRIKAEDRGAVLEALDHVGLAGFDARRPADLSGGQAARVALARMLLRDKPVALMDEPFSALDPALRRDMAALVASLCDARGTTLVIVVHELRGLETLATDLCLLDRGAIVEAGPADALRRAPPDALKPWL